METLSKLPKELLNFLLVVIFSLLIGLEQRRRHIEMEFESLFGTDRTLTLIGILGFILYTIMPGSMGLFIGGGIILSSLLGVYYFNKIKINNKWGFTSIVITLITYCLAPLVDLQPLWLVLLIFVTILIVVEMKENFMKFSKKFDSKEFTLLANFIIIAGIVLPLLSHEPLSETINISPYQIWLSIVAVSGISYISYLLRKFAFPDSGIFISAILGGLYSSTATTIILARKSKTEKNLSHVVLGFFGATGMMYIRILILAWIFNKEVALALLPSFLVFTLATAIVIGVIYFMSKKLPSEAVENEESIVKNTQNPLEFKTALIFGFLFAFFAIVTHFVVLNYGNAGVNALSFIVGMTDIDPYILNLFQNAGATLDVNTIVNAIIIATASNNLMKMIYALVLGNSSIRKQIIFGFLSLILVGFVATLFH